MLWGYSLQLWQTVVFWLWFVAAASGAVAVAASFSSSVISYYISDATETAAKIEIGNAKATAGQANEVAGKANERAGGLEKDAADARLAQEKLRASNLALERQLLEVRGAVASRHLSEAQGTAIAQTLKVLPQVQVQLKQLGDAEAGQYGAEIARALAAAGAVVRVSQTGIMLPPRYGITIAGRAQNPLFQAFLAAEIPFQEILKDEEVISVLVGLKPPGL